MPYWNSDFQSMPELNSVDKFKVFHTGGWCPVEFLDLYLLNKDLNKLKEGRKWCLMQWYLIKGFLFYTDNGYFRSTKNPFPEDSENHFSFWDCITLPIHSSFSILLCLICQNRMYWCHFYPPCTLVCPFSHYTYIGLNDLHCWLLYYIVEKSIAESEHTLQYDKTICHAYSRSCTITVIIFVKMTDFNVCTTWSAMLI